MTLASSHNRDIPIFVLYFGRMTEQRRRDLAWLCRERRQMLLVLDETLLFCLCQERGLRLPVMFQCTFPFTVANPYITTSSDVPTEMFFGRKNARDAIVDRYGTKLVYGGRQLGKTALLRDIARQYHNPEYGFIVRWIDLKAENIGLSRPADDVWIVISAALKEFNIAPQQTVQKNTLIKHIQSWLETDQRRRILFLLDEADSFLLKDGGGEHNHTAVIALKHLMEQTGGRFKVVFAGLHNVQRMSRDINTPIAHLGTPICIGPLLEDGEVSDALQLIRRPLEMLGYRFESSDVINRILSHTNYYPSLIQLFCWHLLEYLNDTTRVNFNHHKSPPYVITRQHVEDAFQKRELRRAIADRFKWTLDLDARYRLIALLIALETIERRQQDDTSEGVTVEWVREQALEWWSRGFEASSFDTFQTILDEMIGLGILRRIGKTVSLYTLRSPNVVNLLGTRSEIEQALLDASNKEPPLIYRAETFRRQVGSSWVRSPLTGQQESEIFTALHGITLLFGLPIAGIFEVVDALKPICATATPDILDGVSTHRQFTQALRQALEGKVEGIKLIVVPPSTPWCEQWVVEGITQISRKRPQNSTKYRLLFIGGPQDAWRWLNPDGSISVGDSNKLMTTFLFLKPWHDNALRQWMIDAGFGPFDDKGKREKFLAATGGWGSILNGLSKKISQNPLNWEGKLEQFINELTQTNSAHHSLQLDLVPNALPVLQVMADYGEPLTYDELTNLLDKQTRMILEQVLRWGAFLNFIRRKEQGHWHLDEFIARQLGTYQE